MLQFSICNTLLPAVACQSASPTPSRLSINRYAQASPLELDLLRHTIGATPQQVLLDIRIQVSH